MKSTVKLTTLLLGLALLWVTGAWAQSPPTPQFFFTGFIQEATLDTTFTICTPTAQNDAGGLPIDTSRLRGGTMTVNGIKMIVPCNSIIQFPAATFTWADMFDPAVSLPVGSYIGTPNPPVLGGAQPVPANPPLGSTVPKTGLALTDGPMPFPSFAVNVNGNVVGKNADGTDKYIVGLIVPVTQQDLNATSGLVSYIDYAFGSFRVGGNGAAGCDAAAPGGGPLCTGTLVQFNDPVGRWGLVHSIDPRFSGDFENTTIHTSTGFPLCIPRSAAGDPLCPAENRPPNGDPRFPADPFLAPGAPLKIFDMPAPVITTQVVAVNPACPVGGIDPITGLPCATQIVPVIDPVTGSPNTVTPDAYRQIPLMLGDQVNIAGTLYRIDPTKTVPVIDPITGLQAVDPVTLAPLTMPDNSAANSYISAHTVEDVLGIFTAPGVAPAYVYIEAFLIGTNGAAVQGILQEASTRMTVVGFTSDPTRLVDIYAIDAHPCSGQESLRLLASEDPAVDAIRGRFVHRVLGGLFMPPTRMYLMKSRTQFLDLNTGLPVPLIAANGIATGQFALPNFEYVFPENHRLGDPIIPSNYQDMPFLALGSGRLVTTGFPGAKTGDPNSPVIGQLNPFPGTINVPTPLTCPAGNFHSPIVTVVPSTAISVAVGATFTLNGAVTFDPGDDPLSRTATWTPAGGTQGGTVIAPTYTVIAPNTPGVLVFTLTASDNVGTGSAEALVNVLAAADIVQIPAGLAVWTEQKGKRGGFGKLSVTATSSDPTANLLLFEDPNEALIPGPACPFISPVDGGICEWGTASKTSPGIYDWIENKGAPLPFSLTVRSDKGGTATVVCGPPTVKNTKLGPLRTVTCP